MNRIVLILFLIISSSYAFSGQNTGYGIYKNKEEYKEGMFSCRINPDSSKDKIRLYHFFPRKYITIIKGGKEYRFLKDSIFGYRDSENKDYRFYKNSDRAYEILENKEIVIYVTDVPVFSSSGKTAKLVPTYFFSTTLNSEILPLTISNLERAFPDKLKFKNMFYSMEAGNVNWFKTQTAVK